MGLGAGGLALLAAKWYFGGRACWETVPVEPSVALELLGHRLLHAAVVDGEKMYVVGGRRDEQYLRDGMALDLKTLTWSALPSFPVSCAGHCLVATEKGLIALVGIPSDELLRAYKFEGSSWSAVKTSGVVPRATRGHSATVIGKQIWVVGGEDFRGDLYGSVHCLDVEDFRWKRINASGSSPCPRSFHGAAVHRDCDLYIFGGRTGGTSMEGGLYHLDTAKMEWSCREKAGMSKAFFGSTVIGDKCYVVGGRGAATVATRETLVLDMRSLGWTVLSVSNPPQLEGASLVHASVEGGDALIACGSSCSPLSQLGLFLLKNTKAHSAPVRAPERPGNDEERGSCLVSRQNGSTVALFAVPPEGMRVRDIEARIKDFGDVGCLARSGVLLYPDNLVFAGEQIMLCSVKATKVHHKLSVMDVLACKDFLSARKIQLITGEGWLKPLQEIDVPAFKWGQGRSLKQQREYLWGHARPTRGAFFNPVRSAVEEVSSSDPESPYTLEFRVDWAIRYMDDPLTAFGMSVQQAVSQESFWRALVALLALNIQNHTFKPWMVITDLDKEWHFAWMDGSSMFVCQVLSRAQALGILHDLGEDYDKLTTTMHGLFSDLPSVSSRQPVGLRCDTTPQGVHIDLINRSPARNGGVLLTCADGLREVVFPPRKQQKL